MEFITLNSGAYVQLVRDFDGLRPAVYMLRHQGGSAWDLVHPNGLGHGFGSEELQELARRGIVKPWRPVAADRAAQLVALRAASPLRSATAQQAVDGLALFDRVRQPALI